MSVAGVVPAFDPTQLWRLVGGLVPACPIGTLVTLSNRGDLLDVARPWTGLVASIDLRTVHVSVSRDGSQCLIRANTGDAIFARVADASAPIPSLAVHQTAAAPFGSSSEVPSRPVYPALPPALAPFQLPFGSSSLPALTLPAELGPTNQQRYLDGSWTSSGYRSARTRARWAQLFFVLVILSSFWLMLQSVEIAGVAIRAAAGTLPTQSVLDELDQSLHSAAGYLVLSGIALAVAFFAWLSRSVDVVPPWPVGRRERARARASAGGSSRSSTSGSRTRSCASCGTGCRSRRGRPVA